MPNFVKMPNKKYRHLNLDAITMLDIEFNMNSTNVVAKTASGSVQIIKGFGADQEKEAAEFLNELIKPVSQESALGKAVKAVKNDEMVYVKNPEAKKPEWGCRKDDDGSLCWYLYIERLDEYFTVKKMKRGSKFFIYAGPSVLEREFKKLRFDSLEDAQQWCEDRVGLNDA